MKVNVSSGGAGLGRFPWYEMGKTEYALKLLSRNI